MSQLAPQVGIVLVSHSAGLAEGAADLASQVGGGTVTVKMDGRKQVLAIVIDPEAVKSGDIEMLQDLVMAAVNEAGRKVDQQMQSSLGGMLGGLGGIL